MKLKSIYEVRGVKVVSGKGKGTTRAQPGDIFECDSALGERLLAEQVAVASSDDLPKDLAARGPEITSGKVEHETASQVEKVAVKAKKSTANQTKALGDLGLGDGSPDGQD